VRNEYLLALQAHPGDHFVEQLTSAADEGSALLVLILAGAFADEHDFGIGIAFPEDRVGPLFTKTAGRAGFHLCIEFGEEAALFFGRMHGRREGTTWRDRFSGRGRRAK